MDGKPIFFLEINSPGDVHDLWYRVAVDDQMRDRFCILYDLTPLPRLHGICAMGQRAAFYCLDKATDHIHLECVECVGYEGMNIATL